MWRVGGSRAPIHVCCSAGSPPVCEGDGHSEPFRFLSLCLVFCPLFYRSDPPDCLRVNWRLRGCPLGELGTVPECLHGHSVLCEGSCLIRADLIGTSHGLACLELSDPALLRVHLFDGEQQGDHHRKGETFRDGNNDHRHHESEEANVFNSDFSGCRSLALLLGCPDGPVGDEEREECEGGSDQSCNSNLPREVLQFSLQGGGLLFLLELRVELSQLRVCPHSQHQNVSRPPLHLCAGKDHRGIHHVMSVLVSGCLQFRHAGGVRRLAQALLDGVLHHVHRLACKRRLIHLQI
mmetsp:Transcript_10522/g.20431  ORF Transcript_10522/g.20431 Transcript_10522/m.20431 type:complete len:293 (-) Transcript_10522:100-978(-)